MTLGQGWQNARLFDMTLESFLTGKIYILIECQNRLLFQKLSLCIKLFCFSANINTSNKNQDIKWNAILFYNFIFGFTSHWLYLLNALWLFQTPVLLLLFTNETYQMHTFVTQNLFLTLTFICLKLQGYIDLQFTQF